MAIFIRREIQVAVNSLAADLTRDQVGDLVGRLNEGSAEESLAAEWEAIVISAFHKCGRITYEQNFGGKTRPDVLFRFAESGSLEFLTDVRMVSDKDPHEKNPYNEFREAIRRFLQPHGHNSAGLHIDVEDMKEGEYGRRKVRLTLPPKDEIETFVTTELGEFLSGIARNPDKNDTFRYDKNEIRFSIRYDGSEKRFAGGGHISYTVPYSVRNPLTNALISKGGQLAKSGYQGTKGIVICDGGCDALNERSRVNGAYGCQEIVEGYLRTHTYILWVLVLRIEQTHSVFPRENAITIKPKLYWNPEHDKSLFRDTMTALERMVACLPRPEATPTNAFHWLNGRTAQVGRPLGGYSMQGNTIKISARALAELLAGRIEPQKFLEDNGFKPHPLEPKAFSFNFFENQIARGNTIQNSFVEKSDRKDDDWIVLEYDGPDPAISPFRVPD